MEVGAPTPQFHQETKTTKQKWRGLSEQHQSFYWTNNGVLLSRYYQSLDGGRDGNVCFSEGSNFAHIAQGMLGSEKITFVFESVW